MSLNSNMPSSKKRLGYAVSSSSLVNIGCRVGLTIISHCTVCSGNDATNFAPPPANTSGSTINAAEAFWVDTDQSSPPFANGTQVLGERFQKLSAFLAVGRLRDESQAMSLDDWGVVNSMLQQHVYLWRR